MAVMGQGTGGFSVVWTRGKGCSELADLLTGGRSNRLSGDLAEGCINHRADLLVSRRLPGSFDLVNVAVPLAFVPENVTAVVATVAGGPHSILAAQTAALVGASLGVEAEMVSASGPGDDPSAAQKTLDRIAAVVPEIRGRVVGVDGISSLAHDLDEGSLLVLGAPGGSWLQRSMLGPGARLRSKAHAGAVVVRSAPDRVFRWMGEPVFVGPMRQANDTLRIHDERVLAVADQGVLIGLVRRERLEVSGDDPVASIMEAALSAKIDETLAEARALEPTFGADPIPVTDHEEHLVGGLSLPAA
ncbi:MAG TPA: hypothetical protein VI980_03900 [Acidimicrobiia bacterium]|nr:hypothetical protein [Acidimicrobiia bacterium]